MNTQKGSAHVVIIIGLVALLIGALGFIFWQNVIKEKSSDSKQSVSVEKEKDSTSTESEVAKTTNATFSNSAMTFEYPSEGWKEEKAAYSNEGDARIETDDYTPSIGMGLDAGADLIVTASTQNQVPQLPGVKDVKDIKIDGNQGYSYALEYEGYRLQAFFTAVDGTGYAITMQTVGAATSAEKKAFDLVLGTLDIK